MEKDVKSLTDNTGRTVAEIAEHTSEHVMLSYEWGCQSAVLLIKNELEKAGYKVKEGTLYLY